MFRALAIALLVLVPTAQAEEKPLTEEQKIEALIKHIEDLKDAKFVRNDREYDSKTAAKFLRGKWDASEGKVKSAKEFIEKIASTSSTTGKPYFIRLAGKDLESGEYLLKELKKIEKPQQ